MNSTTLLHTLSATAALSLAIAVAAAPDQAAPGTPSWRNIGPGGGGWIPCMAVSPHDSREVYAGCDVGGFYKSTDGGATWQIHNTGLHDLYIEVIVPDPRDPRTLYVGTEGGVHRSRDGGETWQWLREGFPPVERYSFSAPIGALAVDPQNPLVLYAGIGRPRWGKSGTGTVYRTDDGGDHWHVANPGGRGMDRGAIVRDLLVHPGVGGRVYAATDRGLYRSDDSGASWRRLDHGLPHASIGRVALCRSHPDVMYLTLISPPGHSPWQGGVYRSDDGGESWSPRLTGLAQRVGGPGAPDGMTSNVDRLVVSPDNPDIAYAGDASWVSAGVERTTDGGQSWQKVTDQPRAASWYGWIMMWGPSVTGLAMDPRRPDTLYFSTSGQIYRTADAGGHWEVAYTRSAAKPAGSPESRSGWWQSTGLEVTCLHDVVVHPRDPRRLYLCYFDIGLLQSFDGGQTFARTVEGMHYQGNTFTVAFDPADSNIVYACTGEWGSSHGDVCRSADGGFTWKVVGSPQTGLPDGQTHHILIDPESPAAARRIYVTVDGAGLFCSEDGGATWAARGNGLPRRELCGLALRPGNPKAIDLLVAGGGSETAAIYRSEDRGVNWRRVGDGIPSSEARSFVVCPSDPQRFYVAARESSASGGRFFQGGVYASRDGGITWARVLDDRFIEALAVNPADADQIFAGGTDHPYHDECLGRGVLESRDGGHNWESLNTPALTCRCISCLALDPRDPLRLYAGTGGNGVFVRE